MCTLDSRLYDARRMQNPSVSQSFAPAYAFCILPSILKIASAILKKFIGLQQYLQSTKEYKKHTQRNSSLEII